MNKNDDEWICPMTGSKVSASDGGGCKLVGLPNQTLGDRVRLGRDGLFQRQI